MDIDITEIMKTGLFELRYEKCGDAGELVITPIIGDFSVRVHDGEEWGPENIFSTKPEKDSWDKPVGTSKYWEENIPWHEISYDYVAMDEDGIWHTYRDKPEIQMDQWYGVPYCEIHDNMPTPPHWTESLVRRPDYEQKAT